MFKVTSLARPNHLKNSVRDKYVFFVWIGPKLGVKHRAKVTQQKTVLKDYFKSVNLDFTVSGDIKEFSELTVADKLDRVGGKRDEYQYDFLNRSADEIQEDLKEVQKEKEAKRKSLHEHRHSMAAV